LGALGCELHYEVRVAQDYYAAAAVLVWDCYVAAAVHVEQDYFAAAVLVEDYYVVAVVHAAQDNFGAAVRVQEYYVVAVVPVAAYYYRPDGFGSMILCPLLTGAAL
jgi:hypothetical protein